MLRVAPLLFIGGTVATAAVVNAERRTNSSPISGTQNGPNGVSQLNGLMCYLQIEKRNKMALAGQPVKW